MSLYFTEEHEMFRQTVRSFVEKEINPYVDEWEAAGREKRPFVNPLKPMTLRWMS